MAKQALDQYYTQPSDAEKCVRLVDTEYGLDSFDLIVEPSAGAGVFLQFLPDNVVAMDLEPKMEGILQKDFMCYDGPKNKRVLTIGNPPFGRRASLAKEFIHNSAKYSEVVAFILPAIFMKPGFTNTLPQFFHLAHNVEGIDTFVLPNGNLHKVNCCFQIWEKRDYKREKVVLPTTHMDFTISHAHLSRTSAEELLKLRAENDFCIGQVTGKIQSVEEVERGSQYFIKDNTDFKKVREVFSREKLTQPHKYNMGAVSFSRADLVTIYSERCKH